MLANRRAARLEEIAEHGRPVSFREAVHKSKKVYDRKRLKRMEQKLSLRQVGVVDHGSGNNLAPFSFHPSETLKRPVIGDNFVKTCKMT